jgi:hypothetical protein
MAFLLNRQAQSYSLRLPPALFTEVVRLAKAEERSVNQIIVHLVTEALRARMQRAARRGGTHE